MKLLVAIAAVLGLCSFTALAQPVGGPVKYPITSDKGGSGLKSPVAGGLLVGNGANPFQSLLPRANGDCPVVSSGAWTSLPCPGGATAGVSTLNGRSGAVTIVNSDLVGAGGLLAANNLSDLANIAAARAALGLGTAATQPATAFLQPGNNLSDLQNVIAARSNLGLGSAATKLASGSGTTLASVIGAFALNDCMKAGDIAGSLVTAGGPCVIGAVVSSFNARTGPVTLSGADVSTAGGLLAASNLADIGNIASARGNLGLGTAAVKSASGTGPTLASVTGAFVVGHVPSFSDTSGTLQDSGGTGGGGGAVSSFNTRTGPITTIATDISSAGGMLGANNLSDVGAVATARTNLGLGSAALLASTAVLQSANNLSELTSTSAARTNLGLGTAATQPTTSFAQVANNLSDLASAATARTNLGLVTVASSGSANDITSGTLGAARLPLPTISTLGGIEAKDCSPSSQVVQKLNTDGTVTCVAPSGAVPSGTAAQTLGYALTGSVVAPFSFGANFVVDTTAKTINLSTPLVTKSGTYTVLAADMGETFNLSGTGTLNLTTIATGYFANQQGICYSKTDAGNWILSSSPAIDGLPSTTIFPGGGGCLISDGTRLKWQPGRAGDELRAANNLSDLASAPTARTNLGLGSAATQPSTNFLLVSNNLSDVVAVTARTNLGLGSAAVQAIVSSGVGVGLLSTNNIYGAGQVVAPFSLTDGASIATNASFSNVFTVTLGGNRTLANPTGVIAGQTLIYYLKQDATGSRTLAYASNFKFPGGAAPTLSPAANAQDAIACNAVSPTFLACNSALNYQ